jgi:hypothetical protein
VFARQRLHEGDEHVLFVVNDAPPALRLPNEFPKNSRTGKPALTLPFVLTGHCPI